uniref:Protein p311 n=1 Tax=Catharus ustulatus TaxID=91951 RepID=A0A8C3UYL0_CATUS
MWDLLHFLLLGHVHSCPNEKFFSHAPRTAWFSNNPLFSVASGASGNLPISKEVNRKKNEEEGARLAPASGYGQHFTKINYLYSF